MVATLSKVGSTFQLSNQRSFDPWGAIRLGATAGDSKGRYCANLGHKQDDESGLVYTRARYYEPTSGRFVSEDPARRGWNWFSYGANDPVDLGDFNGRKADELLDIVKDMFYKDKSLSSEFFKEFSDKGTGLAEKIHLMISRKGYSVDEIKEIVKMKEETFESDMNLEETFGETEEELAGDVADGEDVVLEVEVIEIEEAGG